jgi:hypothetical protein
MLRTVLAAVMAAGHTLRGRWQQLHKQPDAGLTTAEYLMWIAIIAAVVVAVGAIVSALYTSKANGLNLN